MTLKVSSVSVVADMPPHSSLAKYEDFLSNFQCIGVEGGHSLPEKLIRAIQQQRELIAALTARLETLEAATSAGGANA
jgi:4-hydroxy-3-methylbut-2-enyl diphosphate reductase IspH